MSGYDFIAPIVSGVDVSSIAAQVPSWAWPLVLISVTALFQFLRNLADKRHQAELADSPVPAQEGFRIRPALVDMDRDHADRSDLTGTRHVEPVGGAGDGIGGR